MNLAHCIAVWAVQRPNAVALRYNDTITTYCELDAQINAGARRLAQLGIGHGDRVAYLGLNHPQILVLLLALARIGAILAPLNVRLAGAEHAYQLQDSGAKLLIHDDALNMHVSATLALFATEQPAPRTLALQMEWLAGLAGQMENLQRDIVRAAPTNIIALANANVTETANALTESRGSLSDDVLLVYTSGTTGKPKGAVLTQNALLWNCVNAIHAHELTSHDHVLIALPMFHVGGLNILTLPALYVGAQVSIHPRFEPAAFLRDIARLRPSLTILVPAIISALITHPDWANADCSSLRMINTGSSVVPASLIEPWHLRGIPVGQVYGSTETGPIAIYLRAEDAYRKVGSTGLPALHCEARLCDAQGHNVAAGDVGEIWIRGPNLMRTYFNNVPATQAAFVDGWYKTGDLAYCDTDGYFWVVGRSRDMIISGGENIYPAELESVLADCAAIAEAAVIGVADERWGEVPVAAIVFKPDHTLSEQAVLNLFEGRLARFKHPKRIVVCSSLPKTALGKVQKSELQTMLAKSKTR